MSWVNKSIFIFGLNSLVLGAILLFVTQIVFLVVDLSASNESWVYLSGFVLTYSSYYYSRSELKRNPDFDRYTIHTRLLAPIVVVFLIITGKANLHFLPFENVDEFGRILP